jgi:hypothetical protein
MYTLNTSTACAIVNLILSSLNDEIIPYISEKVLMFLAKSKKSSDMTNLFAFALGASEEKQRAGFSHKFTLYNACLIAYLNTFQTCIDYLEKLKSQLVSELGGLLRETEMSVEETKTNFN